MDAYLTNITFDNHLTKENFMALANNYCPDTTTSEDITDHHKDVIKFYIRKLLKTQNASEDLKLVYKKYEVYKENDNNILIRKRESNKSPIIKVLSFDEIYDKLIVIHVSRKITETLVHYDIPKICFKWIEEACNTCQLERFRKVKEQAPNIAEIYCTLKRKSMKRFARKGSVFRCAFIYVDKRTNFTLIRPLLYKVDSELAMEVFKIFTQFGLPDELHVKDCSQEMIDAVEGTIRGMWPEELKVKFIRKCGGDHSWMLHVAEKISQWCKEAGSDQWEIGACIVERQLNTNIDFTSCTNSSSHVKFFSNSGCVNNHLRGMDEIPASTLCRVGTL